MSTQTVMPGQGFDIPGVPGQTTWFDQIEDTNLLSFTPSAVAQQPILGIADFRRTDVVFNWVHHFSFSAVSWTAGTGWIAAALVSYFAAILAGLVPISTIP